MDESDFNRHLRETYVVLNLFRIKEKYNFEVFYKSRTDIVLVFKSWKKIELEIWWKNKFRNDVIVVKDNIIIWDNFNIPMWMFWILV